MKHLAAALLALSLAGCTIGQTRVMFGLSLAADAATTQAGKNGGATEANPALERATLPAMFVLSGIVVLVAEHAAARGETAKAKRLYAVAAAIHGAAALWNAQQLNRR